MKRSKALLVMTLIARRSAAWANDIVCAGDTEVSDQAMDRFANDIRHALDILTDPERGQFIGDDGRWSDEEDQPSPVEVVRGRHGPLGFYVFKNYVEARRAWQNHLAQCNQCREDAGLPLLEQSPYMTMAEYNATTEPEHALSKRMRNEGCSHDLI